MSELANLLRERLCIIGDHELRDRDPAAHLAALQQVSEAIMDQHQQLRAELPARLNHFLTQCSFDKALAYIEAAPGS